MEYVACDGDAIRTTEAASSADLKCPALMACLTATRGAALGNDGPLSLTLVVAEL
jgi:hypothetical protein